MRSRIDKFLWPNRWILIFSGFWPMKPNIHVALRYFNSLRIVFHIMFALAVSVPQIFEIIDKWGNLAILTEVGCITLPMVLLAFKQCYIVSRHIEFEKTYWLLKDLWKFSKTREEAKAIESCAWQGKFFTSLFWSTGFSTYIFYLAGPIYIWTVNHSRSNGSDYDRRLILNCRYWFDPSPTPVFEMTFAWEALTFFLSGHCVLGLDGTMMTIIAHVVGQFRLINVRLKGIGFVICDSTSSIEECDAWTEIKDCVKHHQRVLRIAKNVNSLLGPLIFTQFMVAGMQICLIGYAVMSDKSRGTQLLKYIFLFLSGIVQLVLYCWPGEMLIQESTQIAKTVYYDIPWFVLPCNQQRDLCVIVIRSQRESQITAMGFQVMSLQKLTEVFNAAASYMALLRSMQEKQRIAP